MELIPISKKKEKITISFCNEPAAEDVTGSMLYIETPNHKILVDAGLHQTNDRYEDFLVNNRKPKDFKPKEIDLIFFTHNHGDHCLLAPKLYKDGCRAKSIVSQDSTGVLAQMIMDCAQINMRDVLVINTQQNKNYDSLYAIEEAEFFMKFVSEYPVNEKIKLDNEISFMLIPSGHLLGSVQVLLYITIGMCTKTILVTGDLGNKQIDNRFVGKFVPVDHADLVIGESTYGDRPDLKTELKERENDLQKLKSIINTQVCEMHGRVLIPTFAQSRIQQLVAMIYELYKNDTNFTHKIYVDSPLSIRIFKEYSSVLEGKDLEIFNEMLGWKNLQFIQESEDSKALVASKEPCVILSTAGMCNVGRVRHHLKALVGNPNATILFVGYSTPGTLASLLKDPKRDTITIDTKEYPIRCASYLLKSLSGHAPYWQLVDYYSSINCSKIILHHGSQKAKQGLKNGLEKELSKKCNTARVVIANSSLKFNL